MIAHVFSLYLQKLVTCHTRNDEAKNEKGTDLMGDSVHPPEQPFQSSNFFNQWIEFVCLQHTKLVQCDGKSLKWNILNMLLRIMPSVLAKNFVHLKSVEGNLKTFTIGAKSLHQNNKTHEEKLSSSRSLGLPNPVPTTPVWTSAWRVRCLQLQERKVCPRHDAIPRFESVPHLGRKATNQGILNSGAGWKTRATGTLLGLGIPKGTDRNVNPKVLKPNICTSSRPKSRLPNLSFESFR